MINKEKKIVQESIPESYNNADILSIVIPAFNSVKLLFRCLEALEKQSASKTEFEVTVADDGSTDETLEMLAQFGYIGINGIVTLENSKIINCEPYLSFLYIDSRAVFLSVIFLRLGFAIVIYLVCSL